MSKSRTTAESKPVNSVALNQAVVWILDGLRADDVARSLAAKFPGEDPQATMTAAQRHYERIATACPEVLRGWCLDATREVYRRALLEQQLGTALRAIRQLLDYACSVPPTEATDDDAKD